MSLIYMYVVDNDTLVGCDQTEIKTSEWIIYMYHVNTFDLYSVCSGYAKNNDSEN